MGHQKRFMCQALSPHGYPVPRFVVASSFSIREHQRSLLAIDELLCVNKPYLKGCVYSAEVCRVVYCCSVWLCILRTHLQMR